LADHAREVRGGVDWTAHSPTSGTVSQMRHCARADAARYVGLGVYSYDNVT